MIDSNLKSADHAQKSREENNLPEYFNDKPKEKSLPNYF